MTLPRYGVVNVKIMKYLEHVVFVILIDVTVLLLKNQNIT